MNPYCSLVPSKSAMPLARGAVTAFHGYERQIPSNGWNQGGFPATEAGIFTEMGYNPLLFGTEFVPRVDDQINVTRLFRDITPAECTAGTTMYRGFFLNFTGNTAGWTTTPQVYFSQTPSVGTVQCGFDTLQTDSVSGLPFVQRTSSAPGGVVFSSPTKASPLVGSPVKAGVTAFLWLKRVVPALATATMDDSWQITIQDGVNPANVLQVSFYHTLQAGVMSAVVTGAHDGTIISLPQGETYTITTYAADGVTPIDPPSATVQVFVAGSFTNPLIERTSAASLTGSILGSAAKISTGVYSFEFLPPWPGHWQLVFDCGSECQTQVSVEASPCQ